MIKNIEHRRLLRVVHYNPDTGVFTRRSDEARIDVDAKVSSKGGSYRRVNIFGGSFYAHRLAWFYVHGVWPRYIDHADSDPNNNMLSNLRECSKSQNQSHKPKQLNNSTGFKGVCLHGCGKFMASIAHQNKQRYLGLFATAEQAHAAYVDAAKQLHKDFAWVKV